MLTLPRMKVDDVNNQRQTYYKYNDTHFAVVYTNETTRLALFTLNSQLQIVQAAILDLGAREELQPRFVAGTDNLLIFFHDRSHILVNLTTLTITMAFSPATTPLIFANGSYVITNMYGYYISNAQKTAWTYVNSRFYFENHYDQVDQVSWMFYNPLWENKNGKCSVTKFDQRASTIQQYTLPACPCDFQNVTREFITLLDVTRDPQGNLRVIYTCNTIEKLHIVSNQSSYTVNLTTRYVYEPIPKVFPDYQNNLLRTVHPNLNATQNFTLATYSILTGNLINKTNITGPGENRDATKINKDLVIYSNPSVKLRATQIVLYNVTSQTALYTTVVQTLVGGKILPFGLTLTGTPQFKAVKVDFEVNFEPLLYNTVGGYIKMAGPRTPVHPQGTNSYSLSELRIDTGYLQFYQIVSYSSEQEGEEEIKKFLSI